MFMIFRCQLLSFSGDEFVKNNILILKRGALHFDFKLKKHLEAQNYQDYGLFKLWSLDSS